MDTQIYPKLIIEHNHGVAVLKNARVIRTYEYRRYGASPDSSPQFIGRVVEGEVMSGGVTNRLFHVTSHHPYSVGEQMKFDLFGREIHPVWNEENAYRVSLVTCG